MALKNPIMKQVKAETSEPRSVKHKWYPTMTIKETDLPEIKKWKIGETYDVVVTLKQTGAYDRTNEGFSATFEIRKIGHLHKGK